MIPLFVRIKVKDEKGKGPNLWLPLFLLWPFVILFMLILLPFYLIACLFNPKLIKGITLSPHFLALFSAFKGFVIDIQDKKGDTVYISIH